MFMSSKFTEKAESALNRSVVLAESFGHTYIGTEHLLLALCEDETSCSAIILSKFKINFDRILKTIREYSGVGEKSSLSSKNTTPRCRRVVENSYKICKKSSSEKIGTEHLLYALLDENEGICFKILIRCNAEPQIIKEEVISFLKKSEKNLFDLPRLQDQSIPNLNKYGKNMTKLAEAGKYDPVVGRDSETERIIRILTRKTKNNPVLIGEAGVGKTAIIEGLAQRIAQGNVPDLLKNKTIVSVDLTSMVAGAKYRGDFEERIKTIVNEAEKNKSVVLFIDEIHNIVGAGSAEGAIDAANILKPELSRGEIQIIGATTLSEYKKYIEKDSALERRFQPVFIEEPSIEGAISILEGIRQRYELHHNVIIDDSAIRCAVTLSERYIQDRFLPDKAIDLLDEACALASLSVDQNNSKMNNTEENVRQKAFDEKNALVGNTFERSLDISEHLRLYGAELGVLKECLPSPVIKKTVTENEIKAVINEMAGLKSNFLRDKDLLAIKEKLSSAVVGQEKAISALYNTITRSLAGINEPDRPRGVFMFVGESGVGKTELALALGNAIFGSEDSVIRYDMSEYSEPNATTRLIGASPGYVGYDDANSALERVRRRPYSVILLDEVDKAHPDVLSLFLQVFDNGTLTDNMGRTISFKNSYIVMTSNAGTEKQGIGGNMGFVYSDEKESCTESLRAYFKTEFLNRIDEIIPFSSLKLSDLEDIASRRIEDSLKKIGHLGLTVKISDEVPNQIAKLCKKEKLGARPIIRLLNSNIINKIAAELLMNVDAKDIIIKFFVSGENIVHEVEKRTTEKIGV